jgi:hypothetical protein
VTHRLRSWFLRGVLEALERQYGSAALSLLTEKIPRRLLGHASLDRLRASAALDTISLDEGEELLLFIDSLLGDGGGRVLEAIGQELAAKALGQGGVVKLGDLQGTVARLQAFLDHPFVDTPTVFELRRTDRGFSLLVGVVGRPRATRVLKHLAIGAVSAAERSAREGGGMRLSSDLLADRATLTVAYQRSEPPGRRESELPPTSVKRPTQSFRPPSLSEEVERILSSHRLPPYPPPPRLPSLPSAYKSLVPPEDKATPSDRPSEVQPVAARAPRSERPAAERTSEVQPVASRASSPDSALDRTPSDRRRKKG